MGNPVEPNGYDLGDPCPACWADKTPKRVLAIVVGVQKCPFRIVDVNGSIVLLQILACQWKAIVDGITYHYVASTGGVPESSFIIIDAVATYFQSLSLTPCITAFNNFNTVAQCGPINHGYGGSVALLYGPGI